MLGPIEKQEMPETKRIYYTRAVTVQSEPFNGDDKSLQLVRFTMFSDNPGALEIEYTDALI